MSLHEEVIEAPLAPAQLAARWHALCADPTFEDVAGKIELTEWGEILMTPVGKTHGIAAMRVGEAFGRRWAGTRWRKSVWRRRSASAHRTWPGAPMRT